MFLGKEAVNASALPVWAASRMEAFLEDNGPWNQLIAEGNVDLRQVQGPIELSRRIAAETFPVPHRDEYSETLGIRITGPTASLLYVPDTDGWEGWAPDIEEHIGSVDVAFLDGTFFSKTELPDRDMRSIAHPTVTDSLHRFSEMDAGDRRKIHFTHLNHTNPLLRSDSDEYTRVVRAGFAIATENQLFEL
jgi:pyrroloquinoline quinone biosynthesis protein B